MYYLYLTKIPIYRVLDKIKEQQKKKNKSLNNTNCSNNRKGYLQTKLFNSFILRLVAKRY